MKNVLRGLGLWELSLGVVLVALLAGGIILSSGRMMACGRGQRTLEDMSAILEGCRQYDALYGGWPSSLSALAAVLPQVGRNNVWGDPFVIASSQDRVWVETDVPVGAVSGSLKGVHVVLFSVSGKDRVRLSTSRRDGPSSRLLYEKRNVYGL